MAFDLESLESRFEHIPTEIHSFDEQHQQLEADLEALAQKYVPTLPYGQEVEDFVSGLIHAGSFAHQAIDKGARIKAQAEGVVRVNDHVLTEADEVQSPTPPETETPA